MQAIEKPIRSSTAAILVFSHNSRGSIRSESDHGHRVPYSVGILARVAVNGTQYRLHSSGQQALSRNNVLRSNDVLVEPDPESNLGQVGIAPDVLDQLVAGAYVDQVSYGY